MKGISRFLFKLVEPKSENEDAKRREFILNILLLGSIILSAVANIALLIDVIRLGPAYRGLDPLVSVIIFFIFLGLYYLSRKGFFTLASYIFIGLYLVPTTYTIYAWGVENPHALLLCALIIVMSGVLIGTRFAFLVTLIVSSILVILGYSQINKIIFPNTYWKNEVIDVGDIIVFVFVLIVILIVSWLFNREIEKSLKRARKSEADLKDERDSLEIKVDERTRDLKQVQLEKTLHLYRFAEFGRMTSGLFHDLVNPLTAISLNLENLKRFPQAEPTEAVPRINRALNSIARVSHLITGARQQIQKQEIKSSFSPAEQIALAIHMLLSKARKTKIILVFIPPETVIKTYGNPIKLYRVITALISNAIDAYNGFSFQVKPKVTVALSQENDRVRINVQDWACGISTDNMEKIFDPLFTTKSAKRGVGIGLTITKEIVEKDFNGKIKVKSKQGKGSVFSILFPVKERA